MRIRGRLAALVLGGDFVPPAASPGGSENVEFEVPSADGSAARVRAPRLTRNTATEENAQLTDYERLSTQHINNQPEPVEKLVDLPFSEEDDAVEYVQRMSYQQSLVLKKFSCSVKWRGWGFLVGDQITIKHSARGIYGKYEVIERNVDMGNLTVKMVLGNLRGYEDRPGWWVDGAVLLPSQFSALAGYGSGSVVWNTSWHADIKRWARNNIGYWTDENGFAAPTDPDSFIPSIWT